VGFLIADFLLLCGQRPLFYSFKMGLPLAIKRALKLSNVAYLCSPALLVFLPDQFKSGGTMGQFITEQIILYIGSFSVVFCWELSHHLHQVSINVLIVFRSSVFKKTITDNLT
jgi:nucleoporin NDC1